ncbi:peptide/nickel transport system substrate-binding protein [Halanaerobium sp. DL-01]|uniref:ABC transporter substrate-binding protein n=1 Tax=Halanaerobium sp. DL-01 TaxID=1653064 RepID=UPI000DF16502|nr:ABC transporter substrate-binding protein [Halanaerobium sp. DL-01]RCW86601.1 peptide/nickel transport system substrate-binding protein [Halanaerobium sp. DL-01]
MKKILIFMVLSVFVFNTAFAGAAAIPDDVLVVADNFDAASLDPAVAYEFTSCNTIQNVYDNLFVIDEGEVVPHLAESYQISEDGLKWTIKLREDAEFASGNPINAEAVQFSLQRSMEMGKGPSWMLNEVMSPESITVVDEYTLEIGLKFPASYFASVLSNTCAGIVDPEVVMAHEEDGDWGEGWLNGQSGEAASGPYKLVTWNRGDSIVLERNENYWGEKPNFRQVIIKNVSESVTQKMMLENGDIDMAYKLTPDQLADLEANEDLNVIKGVDLRAYYLGMNVSKEPLNNLKVRQAIKHAIDYNAMIEHLVRGAGNKLEGAIVKPLLGYQEDMGVYEYNPEKAKQLLAEAGYPDGFDIELTGISSTMWKQVISSVQNDLSAVGINAEVRQLNAAAFYELFRNQQLELMLSGWGSDYPDPHNFIHPFGHSEGSLTQRVAYSSKELDDLIEEAAEINDPEKRKELYHKIDRMLAEEGPWAMLYQPQNIVVLRNEVKGYEYNPVRIFDFTSAYK